MKTQKKKPSNIATFVLCLLLFFLFLHAPTESSEQLYRGMRLCAEALIPTLFPFMVISEMIVRSGAVSVISPAIVKITEKLFGISGSGGTAIILGILCGFPIGAKTAAELYDKGAISKEEAERLMGICNLPSPPFIIFAVGEKLFGSRNIGLLLYLNVLAVTMLTGILRKVSYQHQDYVKIDKAEPIYSVFTESVASAAGAVIKVCAYVAFFSGVIGALTPFLEKAPPTLKAAVFSFFELTSGAAACSSLFEKGFGIILASAAVGWSGFSVFCQIFSISRTKRGNISMRYYISSKILSSAICAAISAVFLKLFPSVIPSAPTADDAVSLISLYPDAFICAVDLIFVISIFIYLIKNLDRRHII
jgi:sporulation integral membrane protein YlbJ